jgi:putative lysine transport system permease protein
MMVQALIFKFGCQALGLNWENVTFPSEVLNVFNGWLIAGLIVITLNTAAYMGEIVQSGLNGVDKGQVEGARSLGMTSAQTSISIILPQAIRNALPTIGNELIVNIKDSSVLNVIAVSELFYRLKDIATTNYAFLE